MKKLESTLKNMTLSLGAISLLSGALLGGIYIITKEPILAMQQQQQIEAIGKVAPTFTNNPEADKWEYTDPAGNHATVYPAYDRDTFVGAAVETNSMNGFSGEIRVMCGFEKDGTVRNYKVLSHSETPGLGSKMQQWFTDSTASRSVINKNPSTTSFYVSKDSEQHGEIDAITAATISSRAFLESIRNAHKAYQEYINQQNISTNE